ncbi:MAG: hypothetical protein AABW59_04615, partial [archaeon]
SAEVALYHHFFQKNPYPTTFPRSLLGKSPKQQARFYALLLSFADHYDAATTRTNSKRGQRLSPAGARKNLVKEFPQFRKMIMSLYDRDAFNEAMPFHPMKSILLNPRVVMRIRNKRGKLAVYAKPKFGLARRKLIQIK